MEPHGLNKSGARGSTAVYATCPLVEPRLQTATLLIEISMRTCNFPGT